MLWNLPVSLFEVRLGELIGEWWRLGGVVVVVAFVVVVGSILDEKESR